MLSKIVFSLKRFLPKIVTFAQGPCSRRSDGRGSGIVSGEEQCRFAASLVQPRIQKLIQQMNIRINIIILENIDLNSNRYHNKGAYLIDGNSDANSVAKNNEPYFKFGTREFNEGRQKATQPSDFSSTHFNLPADRTPSFIKISKLRNFWFCHGYCRSNTVTYEYNIVEFKVKGTLLTIHGFFHSSTRTNYLEPTTNIYARYPFS